MFAAGPVCKAGRRLFFERFGIEIADDYELSMRRAVEVVIKLLDIIESRGLHVSNLLVHS